MNYPGFAFTTEGYRILRETNNPTTERLLLIGTALDGPKNEPVRVTSYRDTLALFGPATYTSGYKDPLTGTESGADAGASLGFHVTQALAAGCGDIWVVRATGEYAGVQIGSVLDVRSVYPGRIYNEVSLSIATASSGIAVTLNQPEIKGGPFVSHFASGFSISQVIDQLNSDRRNRTIFIRRETYPAVLTNACTTIPSGTFTLTGGTNGCRARGDDFGVSVSGYANALVATDSGTFDQILGKGFQFSICSLTNIYFDDEVVPGASAGSYSIASDFVYWLDKVSADISPCHGVMGVRPPNLRDPAAVIDYIKNNLLAEEYGVYDANLRWIKSGPLMKAGWRRTDPIYGQVDLGRYLSVVAGPEQILAHPELGRVTDMWHTIYAGMLSRTPPERATVYMPIPGTVGRTALFPRKYAQALDSGVGFDPETDLSGKGAYVSATQDPRNLGGPLLVVNDPTAAARDDIFRNHQTVHLVNVIHQTVSDSLAGFLGKAASAANLANMETLVENILEGFFFSGALAGTRGVGYDFKISMDGASRELGIVRVHLSIIPTQAIRQIQITVTVKRAV